MTVTLPTLPQWTGVDQERHKQRAIQAIAHERCVTDLTDGFCGPRDGKCQRQGSRQGECIKQAVRTGLGLKAQIMRRWRPSPPSITDQLAGVLVRRA